MSEIVGYLVWVKGTRGFVPEKRPAGYTPTKDEAPPVTSYPLNSEQYAMSLLILEQRFPCQAKLEDEPAPPTQVVRR